MKEKLYVLNATSAHGNSLRNVYARYRATQTNNIHLVMTCGYQLIEMARNVFLNPELIRFSEAAFCY